MKIQRLLPVAILAGVALASAISTAHAADVAAGKQKSAMCTACHGANGISKIPLYPNLAGQKQRYLVSALKKYRDGRRPDVIMGPMSKGLSDQDIQNLAAYYSKLNASGK